MPNESSSPPGSIADLARLAEMFEVHRAKLLAMVQRRLDRSLAARLDPEDVLSEAFLEARRRWPNFDPRATPPYVWLYGIVRERLLDAWRRATRRGRDVHREMPWPERSSLQLGMGLVNPGTSPSQAASREEMQERMRRTMDALKDSDKEILTMRHYDDLSFGEAARVLGITENAATVRYVRALKRLKALWDGAEQPEGPQP
jgi:RNA polymerase sigma-70 factor (ECF subfamily)